MTDDEPFRIKAPEERAAEAERARKLEGYPLIEDPEHPLYAEQQAGWPNMPPWEAMKEAILLRSARGFTDSRSHPAFDPGYIVNSTATRPDDDAALAPGPSRERARR